MKTIIVPVHSGKSMATPLTAAAAAGADASGADGSARPQGKKCLAVVNGKQGRGWFFVVVAAAATQVALLFQVVQGGFTGIAAPASVSCSGSRLAAWSSSSSHSQSRSSGRKVRSVSTRDPRWRLGGHGHGRRTFTTIAESSYAFSDPHFYDHASTSSSSSSSTSSDRTNENDSQVVQEDMSIPLRFRARDIDSRTAFAYANVTTTTLSLESTSSRAVAAMASAAAAAAATASSTAVMEKAMISGNDHFSYKSLETNRNDQDHKQMPSILSVESNVLKENIKTLVVESKEQTSVIPSYKTLILFASTTILIWLSEPLLSLVDTTVVGLTQQSASAVVQLASLGPATTLIDSFLYMTYFLAIATTNQIAALLAKKEYRALQRTTSHVLGVATVLGVACMAFIYTFGRPLIVRMAGASATPELVQYALRYSVIRATTSIPSVVGMVAQSFCLATLDTKTPVLAVAAASIVNLIGDFALCPTFGVQGAAVATAASTIASTWILMRAVRRKMKEWRVKELEQQEERQRQQQQNRVAEELSIHPIAASDAANEKVLQPVLNRMADNYKEKAEIPLLSLPDGRSFLDLVKLSGPIFFSIVAKIACYSAMTLRCTEFGVIPLAAHNIMMRIFFFFGCYGDSLSQTAQSFLPAALLSKASPEERQKNFNSILKRLVIMSTIVAVMNWQASKWILCNLGRFLTQEPQIVNLMRVHSGYLGLALLLHPFILTMEGTVVSTRDFKTLVGTYAATLALHFGILKYFCPSFPAVWRVFFLFQSIRLTNFSFCVWRKQRAMKREEKQLAATALNGIAG